MFCKNCGAQLDDSARFCNICGTQLGEVAVSSAPEQTEAVQPVTPQPEVTQPASVQPMTAQAAVPQYSGQRLGAKSVPLPKFFGILALLMAMLSVLMMWITPQVSEKSIYEDETYTQSGVLSDLLKSLDESIEYYEERIAELEEELEELRYNGESSYSDEGQYIREDLRTYKESLEEMKAFRIAKILYFAALIVGGLGVLLLLASVISRSTKPALAIIGIVALIVYLACMIIAVYVIIAGEVNETRENREYRFGFSGAGWIAAALDGMAMIMTTIGILTNKKSDKQGDKSVSVQY